jgi:TRAP-type C4-dicarboxylate transport system permease small subunit
MHRLIQSIARLTALVGGLILLSLVLMMTITITGRSTGLGELTGSYELLEAGIAFAIFSFLPITQLYGAHASVDVFTSFMSRRVNRWIAVFWEVVLLLIIGLIVWRLYEGTLSHYKRGGTTTFLQFKLWVPYAACCAAGVVTLITAAYCVIMRAVEAVQNRSLLPTEHAEH